METQNENSNKTVEEKKETNISNEKLHKLLEMLSEKEKKADEEDICKKLVDMNS